MLFLLYGSLFYAFQKFKTAQRYFIPALPCTTLHSKTQYTIIQCAVACCIVSDDKTLFNLLYCSFLFFFIINFHNYISVFLPTTAAECLLLFYCFGLTDSKVKGVRRDWGWWSRSVHVPSFGHWVTIFYRLNFVSTQLFSPQHEEGCCHAEYLSHTSLSIPATITPSLFPSPSFMTALYETLRHTLAP